MPKEVDHEKRRGEIADSILAIIAADGIGGVTFRSVAEASGWSTGVLGHYFGNRDAMLLAALRRAAWGEHERQKLSRRNLQGVDLLVALLEEVLPIDPNRLALTRIFVFYYAEALSDATLASEVDGYLSKWRRAVEHSVVACQTLGELDRSRDPSELAIEAVALADGLSIHALFHPEILEKLNDEAPFRQWLRMNAAHVVAS